MHYFATIVELKLELQSRSAQFGSQSAIFGPVCYFRLGELFHNHRWIQTRVTVRKRPIWVKIGNFWSRMTLKFDGWKAINHLFYDSSNCVHHFIATCEFKLELQSGNSLIVFWSLWPWPFYLWTWPLARTSLLSVVIQFHDDTMTGTLWKRCDRQTDGQRQKEVFLGLFGHS